jgi:hypothetical protein
MSRLKGTIPVLLLAVLAGGCGGDNAPVPSHLDTVDPAERSQYLLDAEPAGAKGVIEVREQAKDGDTVVVVGKIGGHKKPFGDGRASFLMVDQSLECGDETCWDFS